jgi:hypothetical protein
MRRLRVQCLVRSILDSGHKRRFHAFGSELAAFLDRRVARQFAPAASLPFAGHDLRPRRFDRHIRRKRGHHKRQSHRLTRFDPLQDRTEIMGVIQPWQADGTG